MWHEARKQEKFIRTVMVDVKKRAERRKDFYEKIKLDPIRFLRLYGTKSKINIDPEISIAAEHPNTLMTWTGDNHTIIDRFDGRANLDGFSTKTDYNRDRDEKLHERMCNYERYRCLVHNQHAKITEVNALNRIELAEKYGEDIYKVEKKQTRKKLVDKAAIGYVYSDTDYMHNPSESDNDSESQDSDPDLDLDLDIEIDVNRLVAAQQRDLVKMSQQFGMRGNDYLKLMKLDKSQEEDLRTAKILEEQKAQFHGRKSRRERKIFKEQRLRERYMRQDPRTLTFGASSFHEEIYEGKHLLTPSPKRNSQSLSPSPTIVNIRNSSSPPLPPSLQKSSGATLMPSINHKITNESSRNLKEFLKLPKPRDLSRSRSRSRGGRDRCSRSISPVYGPRLPFSGVKSSSSSNKKSSYRDKTDNRDKRRKYKDNRSRSPDRNFRNRNDRSGRSRFRDKIPTHNYHLSKSRSPELPEEEILKKKYYLSDPDDKSSSSSSSDSSDSRSKSKDKSDHKESNIKKTGALQHNYNQKNNNNNLPSKFNPKDLLKRQMEIQLNRAYRADKKAEQEKQLKVEKERTDRENQLREMAFQIRKRERERRRREREKSSRSPSTSTTLSDRRRSRSREWSRDKNRSHRRSTSRSHRSKSREKSKHYYR